MPEIFLRDLKGIFIILKLIFSRKKEGI
jgi:hypothetical protein